MIMFSKFVRPCLMASMRVARSPAGVPPVPRRAMSGFAYIPPDQYDQVFPKKLILTHAMVVHWEIIPVIVVTAIALTICLVSICWFIVHKENVVYSTHNYNTIERTMDLMKPDIHKFIVINQRYDPWPEMQIVLNKMTAAEKRALTRLQTCKQI